MTHAEFVLHIRQTHARLFDPNTSEETWSLFLTTNTGWNGLIEEYLRRVEVFLRKHGLLSKVYIRQIEEKWGGLRCYLSPTNDFRLSAEAAAALGGIYYDIADRSYHTCDVCGETGRLMSNNGRYLTRCNDHIADRGSQWTVASQEGALSTYVASVEDNRGEGIGYRWQRI